MVGADKLDENKKPEGFIEECKHNTKQFVKECCDNTEKLMGEYCDNTVKTVELKEESK